MDAIFKALNDTSRRDLLDRLRQKDGQSLLELQEVLDMTRFGVMKHLRVLEHAHLIVTRKQGRFKYHFLNALPLQEVIDRWIEPLLAKPKARQLIDLKAKLEGSAQMSDKPDFVMQTFIRTTQDALWNALTDPAELAKFHFICNDMRGGGEEGSTISYIRGDGSTMLDTEVLKLDPKSRIETSFVPYFFGPDAPSSRCVYLIEPQGEQCKLTVEHYDIPAGQESVSEGWARLTSSLKSYLETGSPMKMAM